MAHINPASFNLQSISFGGAAGGANFVATANEFGREMKTVKSTSLGAMFTGLQATEALNAVSGSANVLGTNKGQGIA